MRLRTSSLVGSFPSPCGLWGPGVLDMFEIAESMDEVRGMLFRGGGIVAEDV